MSEGWQIAITVFLAVCTVLLFVSIATTAWPIHLYFWVRRLLNPTPTLQDLSKKARR